MKLIKKGAPYGVGRALKVGFSNVNKKSAYVLTMDSDFIENIKEIRQLIKVVEEEGYDGAIGSRFIRGSRMLNYPFIKKIMNRLYNNLARWLFNIKQRDLTNNFKLYKTNIFLGLPWKGNNYSINAETGMLPIICGYNIAEVPVSWVARGFKMGKSKFKLFRLAGSYLGAILYGFSFKHSNSFYDYCPHRK